MALGTYYDYRRVVRGASQFSRLLKCDCINGFGVARKRVAGNYTNDLCIVIYVNQKLPVAQLPLVNRIPTRIVIPDDHARGGVIELLTDVEEARFIALQGQAPVRPAVGGVSISRLDQNAAGTFGGLVYDEDTRTRVILSNNHVMAEVNLGAPGDEIVQPGVLDGGTAADVIARLTRFIQIYFDNEVDPQGNPRENLVDAAIAAPVNQTLVAWETLAIGPRTPGAIKLLGAGDLGLPVQKYGRTTLRTQGFVQTLHATVTVKYELFQKARFVDQIIISQNAGQPDFSAAGDSGSLIYDMAPECVGLLFAGSASTPTTPGTTIANPIRNVYRALHLRSLGDGI